MRKIFTFLIVLFAFSIGWTQTISSFKMGQSQKEVKAILGKPDLLSADRMIFTKNNVKITCAFRENKLLMIHFAGVKDPCDQFKSLKGVSLGDTYAKVHRLYGKPLHETITRIGGETIYKNILFRYKQTQDHETVVSEIQVYSIPECGC